MRSTSLEVFYEWLPSPNSFALSIPVAFGDTISIGLQLTVGGAIASISNLVTGQQALFSIPAPVSTPPLGSGVDTAAWIVEAPVDLSGHAYQFPNYGRLYFDGAVFESGGKTVAAGTLGVPGRMARRSDLSIPSAASLPVDSVNPNELIMCAPIDL